MPGSEQLGRNIAEEFAKGYNSVLLENHGVVCGGKDLFSALFSLKHFFTSVVPINSDLIVLSACPQVKKKTACLSATSQRLERML